MYALTSRSIPMHASVPELVKRTISTDGTASITIFARTFSRGPGAPKLVPTVKYSEVSVCGTVVELSNCFFVLI